MTPTVKLALFEKKTTANFSFPKIDVNGRTILSILSARRKRVSRASNTGRDVWAERTREEAPGRCNDAAMSFCRLSAVDYRLLKPPSLRDVPLTSQNLMGDFVEGSGGLVLQMTLDRRVVVFGRGRVLPENQFPRIRLQPGVGGKLQEAVAGEKSGDDEGGEDAEEEASRTLSKWSVHRHKNA